MSGFEGLASSHALRVAVAAATLASLLAACGRGAPDIPIGRCSDELQDHPDIDLSRRPLALTENAGGVVTGDRTEIPEDTEKTIKGAVVKVTYDRGGLQGRRWYASGTLTRDSNNRLIAVTAAHAVAGPALGNLDAVTVTGTDGRTSKVTGGCYTYEDRGTQDEVPSPEQIGNTRLVEYDVAALVLADDIGTATVPVVNRQLVRGRWYPTFNFGGNAPATEPRHYNICVIADDSREGGPRGLSGLEPFRGNSNYPTEAVASGGGVFELNPRTGAIALTGTLVATEGRGPTPLDQLNFRYQVTVQTSAQPYLDVITPGPVINEAVEAAP